MAESVIAVKEETVRVGGAEVTKKTMFAASKEGVVLQVHTIQSSYPPIQSQPNLPALPPTEPSPALRPTGEVYTDSDQQANNCCARRWCECDPMNKWYSPYGKGWGILLVLLLIYLLFGVFIIAVCVWTCLRPCSPSDDNRRTPARQPNT